MSLLHHRVPCKECAGLSSQALFRNSCRVSACENPHIQIMAANSNAKDNAAYEDMKLL